MFPERPRALITGAGSGIGRAIALELAARKARVLATDIHSDRVEETADLVRKAGGEAQTLVADVTKPDDWQHAKERLSDGVDIVVNNAGIAAGGRVGEMSLEDWRHVLATNLDSVINGCHVFLPILRAQRRGWILNVASCAGIASLPLMAAYNVSKAGVIALSETLHSEVAQDGVGVSVLCPTFVPTNLMETFRGGPKERKLAEAFFRRSKSTVEHTAKAAVRGLERGTLFILPQSDGRWVWRLKRMMPATYFKLLKKHPSITRG